jgi:hypothetical protein
MNIVFIYDFDMITSLGRGDVRCFHCKLSSASGIILKAPCFIRNGIFWQKFVNWLERSEHRAKRLDVETRSSYQRHNLHTTGIKTFKS